MTTHMNADFTAEEALNTSLETAHTSTRLGEVVTSDGFEPTTSLQTMSTRLDDLMTALRALQDRLDQLEETKKSGCGFSCSNNTFTL